MKSAEKKREKKRKEKIKKRQAINFQFETSQLLNTSVKEIFPSEEKCNFTLEQSVYRIQKAIKPEISEGMF